MTVRLEAAIRRYIGASTDEKPVLGSQLDGTTIESTDLPAGSSFMETDTGHIYRWNGEQWTLPAPDADEQLYVLSELLIEMRHMRQVVELAIG